MTRPGMEMIMPFLAGCWRQVQAGRRHFVAVTEAEVATHFYSLTDCGSSRFHSREEAVRHVELHQAGLVRRPGITAHS